MKISELSGRSGTSVASIKYYIREGLLPSGITTVPNQAEYGESHVTRLRLIRALIDVGGLSVAAARDVLSAVDSPDLSGHALLGAAHYSLNRPGKRDRADPRWRAARDEVAALVRRRGWDVEPDSTNIDGAADALAAIRALGQDDLADLADTYAEVAERVAEEEVALVVAREDPVRMVEGVVVGTILGEALLNALRRLAQQDASARRLRTSDDLASGRR
jgi:DNA-binding transcriptional MerR regulator